MVEVSLVRFVYTRQVQFSKAKKQPGGSGEKNPSSGEKSGEEPEKDQPPPDESKLPPLAEGEESSPDHGFKCEPGDDKVIKKVVIRVVKKKKKRVYVFKIESEKLTERQVGPSVRLTYDQLSQ